MLSLIFVLSFSVSCSSKDKNEASEEGNQAGDGVSVKAEGDNEFIREEYGFGFRYNLLGVDDKIHGDQFVELSFISGDTATVSIQKPDPLVGDNPEQWLMNSFKSSDYQIYERKEMKIGKYPALLVEYGTEILKTPMRIIDLTAYKDGYFYSLIVVMKEESAEDSRQQFDVVVDSFTLFDNIVDLDKLKLWKEAIPDDFPFDLVELIGVEEVESVWGDPMTESGYLTVIYDVKQEITNEEVQKYYNDLLKGSEGYEYDEGTDPEGVKKTEIYGSVPGYRVEVVLRYYPLMEKTTVKVDIRK